MIAVSARGDLILIALLDNDVLLELYVWDRSAPDGIGDLYTGRVDAVEKALAGCFVTLDKDISGFLPDSAGGKQLSQGQYACVRITRAGQNGKGPRLRLEDTPPGEKIGLIARGPGPLLELAERFPNADIVLDDYAVMAVLRPTLAERMRHDSKAFDPVLEDEVTSLLDPIAPLPHGARLHITQAPAATLLDVDAAAASSLDPTALNKAILPEICRQIRLRNLSGGIFLDFAGLKSTQRQKLLPLLANALRPDPLAPVLLGLSHLGFAEINRRRVRPPLSETLRL